MPRPRATYRVQLQPGFEFSAASQLAGYLADLGISHLYASPITQAVPGSAHGYDVVDPGRVNGDLGGEPGLLALHRALAALGIGLLVDVVPNHRAAHHTNREWWSLLRDGRDGIGDRFFDVDWDAPGAGGRVVLPFLDRPLDQAVREGHVQIAEDPELGTVVCAGALVLPVAPGTGDPGDDPAAVLAVQHYRLMFWRDGEPLVNYRRFFDISSLPAVRVDDATVFDAQHALVARALRDGIADGVRVDHVDGLRDPIGYLRRLRALGARWVVVEKILGRGEAVPDAFDADGTTGYEFAERAGGVLVDPEGEAALTRLWEDISGDERTFAEVAVDSRAFVLERVLGADLDRVSRAFAAALGDVDGLRTALAAVLAALDVYRTYVGPGEEADANDRARVDAAVTRASGTSAQPELVAAIRDVLTGARRGHREDDARLRFQQLSSAVAAKGVEDTALYRYLRLTARNDVGGDPGGFAWTLAEFHAANAAAAARHPQALLALSTHDTKRSADVRARLAVLSEIPEEWRAFVTRRSAAFASAWGEVPRDRVAEYLLLQTAVGVWPIERDRLCGYLRKAARESKQRTSWHDPVDEYEAVLPALVATLLEDAEAVADVERIVGRLLVAGRTNSLAQLVLQCAAPGLPDVFQGDELWNLSLVDPDNRAPLDAARCAVALDAVRSRVTPPAAALADRDDPGTPKLWTLVRALDLRRRRPELFAPGVPYAPVTARGEADEHVVAFARGADLVVVAPRLTLRLGGCWADTTVLLGEGRWHDVLSGQEQPGGPRLVADMLASFPVALLERIG